MRFHTRSGFDLRPSLSVLAWFEVVVRTPLQLEGQLGFVLQFLPVEIHPSARKHGIADEDIEHATTHAMTIENQDDDSSST
jgi:hypothetical protein